MYFTPYSLLLRGKKYVFFQRTIALIESSPSQKCLYVHGISSYHDILCFTYTNDHLIIKSLMSNQITLL